MWFTAKATRIYMVQPQTTRIYMVTQINVPYLFAATRYCMVLPQTTRIYLVTQINVPYLCGDHNDTLYLWGHHLVSDRIYMVTQINVRICVVTIPKLVF